MSAPHDDATSQVAADSVTVPAVVDLARARELYATGISLREVAKQMAVPCGTLLTYLNATGGYGARSLGSYQSPSEEDCEKIYALLRRGAIGSEISAATGWSDSAISKVARDHGFLRRGGPCSAPGRRRYLYLGEGSRAVISQVWCNFCRSYVAPGGMVRSTRSPEGYASSCSACANQRQREYRARKKQAAK
jgi:hypothetical protein